MAWASASPTGLFSSVNKQPDTRSGEAQKGNLLSASSPLLREAQQHPHMLGTLGAAPALLSPPPAESRQPDAGDSWVLEAGAPGFQRQCSAGRRPASKTECLAAVLEGALREGMEDPLEKRLKTVNESNRSTVPPGCSFSPLSRAAVFNLNPNATGCTNQTEGCYRLACGGVPKTLVLTVATDEQTVRRRVVANAMSQPALDFGVVLYKGDAANWTKAKARVLYSTNRTLRVRQGERPAGAGNYSFVPKFHFHAQVPEWIAEYEYVWLIDDDISLVDFNATAFFRRHQRMYPTGPPLVAQPTISAEWPQDMPLVNEGDWPEGAHVAVTNMVEQQAPIMDTRFWRWLQNQSTSLRAEQVRMHTDYGYDTSWCAAAAFYATTEPPRLPLAEATGQRTACGIINVPVFHEDTRSIGWESDGGKFIERGFEVMRWICEKDGSMARFFNRKGYWPARATQILPAENTTKVPYPPLRAKYYTLPSCLEVAVERRRMMLHLGERRLALDTAREHAREGVRGGGAGRGRGSLVP